MSQIIKGYSYDEDSMIKIRNVRVYDFDESIEASKFPKTVKPDSVSSAITDMAVKLAQCKPGTGHDNYLQGIRVAFTMDITVKALVEAERYHFFDIVSSTSTMHMMTKFDLNECYCKYVDPRAIDVMRALMQEYNSMSDNDPAKTEKLLVILYTTPCGFTYTIRFTTDYRQLKTIFIQRHDHRIPEWREFCSHFIEKLPHSELITGRRVKSV
jgi:hypothetical protein